jgi:hypothetical protein
LHKATAVCAGGDAASRGGLLDRHQAAEAVKAIGSAAACRLPAMAAAAEDERLSVIRQTGRRLQTSFCADFAASCFHLSASAKLRMGWECP